MRFALMIEPQQGLSYDEQLAVARRAEAAGFEAFFRSDHYTSFPGGSGLPDHGRLGDARRPGPRDDARSRLGALVSPVTFRIPGDVREARHDRRRDERRPARGRPGRRLERGRAPRSSGIPVPADRASATIASRRPLAVIHGLWTEPDGWSFDGHSVHVEGAPLRPRAGRSAGRPHAANGTVRPRIIVGGEGSPRGFRIAARWADEFNVSSSSPERDRRDARRCSTRPARPPGATRRR